MYEGISHEDIEMPQAAQIEETQSLQNRKKGRFKCCHDIIQEIEDFVDQHGML